MRRTRVRLATARASAGSPSVWSSPRAIWRAGLPVLAFAAAYVLAFFYLLATRFVPAVVTQNLPAPFFPPEGVILAALLLAPSRHWWRYLLLAAAIELALFTALHYPLWWILLGAVPDTLEPLLAARLLSRLTALPPRFASRREVASYVGCVTVAALLAALLGGAQHVAAGHPYWSAVWPWFVGDVLANLVLAPTIVLWLTTDFQHLREALRARAGEGALLGAALLVTGLVVFGAHLPLSVTASTALIVPVLLLLWAAVRFGPRGLVTAQSLVIIFAVASARSGLGPFVATTSYQPVYEMQLFFFAIGLPLLFLAAATREGAETRACLSESEARFRTMADQAPVLIWMSGPDARCTYFNARWLAFTGRTLEQELGNGWAAGVHPDDLPACLDGYLSAFAARRPFSLEYRLRRADGAFRWVLDDGVPRFAPDGRFEGYIGSCVDFTDRKQAEMALRTSEARYRAVVETQTELIIRYRPDLTLTFVNDATCRFHGLTREELLGTSILATLPAEAAARVRAMVADLLARPDPGIVMIEHEARYSDGSLHWQQWVNRTIRDATGQVIELQGIGRDITERKRMERELVRLLEAERDARRRLETVLEVLPAAVIIADARGRPLHANQAFRDAWGAQFLADSSAEDDRLSRGWHPDGRPMAPEDWAITRAVQQGETVRGQEVEIEVFDGTRRTILNDAAPLRDEEGEVTGAVVAFVDITERKELERERTLAALLGALSQQFLTLAEHSPDAIVRLDPSGRCLYANRAGTALLGLLAERCADKAVDELDLSQEAAAPCVQALREVVATRMPRTLDVAVRAPDGQPRSLHMRFVPEFGDDGTLRTVLAIATDVTALKRAEARLEERERQYRTLVEHAPDVIIRFDRELRQVYLNPRAETSLGIPARERLGKTYAQLGLPEALYAPWERALREVFATREPITLDFASPFGSGDGRIHYFRARYIPEFDAHRRVESVLGMTTDVTELRQAEQALREANARAEAARQEEERRKQIAESLRDALAILNSGRSPDEVLRYIAHQVNELLGSSAAVIYAPDRLLDTTPGGGATVSALCVRAAEGLRIGGRCPRPRGRLPFADSAVERALATGGPVVVLASCGHLLSRADAAAARESAAAAISLPATLPAPYQTLLAVPIRAPDRFYGCLLLFYTQACHFAAEDVALARAYADQITQVITNARLQIHLEREAAAAERNRLARELHDTVTQEVFSASLIAESLPRIWRVHPAPADAGLQQLHELTRSAQAGLRALLLELRPGELERSPLAEALRKLTAAMSARVGVPIALDVEDLAAGEPPLPAEVKVACYRVAQEALMNAAKYAHARTVALRLRTPGPARVELEIRDDGRGFDPAAVPAGHLGLAIMRERAQSVGAHVRVQSQAGEGTMVVMAWRRDRRDRRHSPDGSPARPPPA